MKRLKIAALLVTLLTGSVASAAPVSLTNASFESDWTNAVVRSDSNVTFNYQPTGPAMGWSFGASTGVAASYSFLSAYEGNRFAFLQTQTQTLSQAFTLDTSAAVNLDFALALRRGYYAGQVVGVSVDGNQVSTIAATSFSWSLQTLNLGTLSAGSHTLSFSGLTPYEGFRDTTAFIDAVHLNAAPVPEPTNYAMLLAGLGLMAVTARRRTKA